MNSILSAFIKKYLYSEKDGRNEAYRNEKENIMWQKESIVVFVKRRYTGFLAKKK